MKSRIPSKRKPVAKVKFGRKPTKKVVAFPKVVKPPRKRKVIARTVIIPAAEVLKTTTSTSTDPSEFFKTHFLPQTLTEARAALSIVVNFARNRQQDVVCIVSADSKSAAVICTDPEAVALVPKLVARLEATLTKDLLG